LRLVKKGYIS